MDKLTATDYKKIEARERRRRNKAYAEHLKKLHEDNHNYPVGSFDKNREYTDDPEDIEYHQRYWRERCSKEIKKDCNRKVRRNNDELYQGSLYKRLAEFWWSLW